jgi:hypothetical protein
MIDQHPSNSLCPQLDLIAELFEQVTRFVEDTAALYAGSKGGLILVLGILGTEEEEEWDDAHALDVVMNKMVEDLEDEDLDEMPAKAPDEHSKAGRKDQNKKKKAK